MAKLKELYDITFKIKGATHLTKITLESEADHPKK